MADIEIKVPIKSVFREVARRSSVATETDPFYAQKTTEDKQYSQLHGEGDRITSDFTKEAAKEVLKAYLSRQGDVTGIAYEYDRVTTPGVEADPDATPPVIGVTEVRTGDIIYRFAENTTPLATKQSEAIIDRLTNNTRDAIVYYVLVSLYRTDGNQVKEAEVLTKAFSLIDELSGDLYRLHD